MRPCAGWTGHRNSVQDMKDEAIQRLLDGLGTEARLIETHISWVLLHRDRAWKIKKPVRFAFLDFSTLAQRAHFCRRELELNRRFSPDIYLGLSTVRLQGGRPGLDLPTGRLLDYAVRMRRMDQDQRLDLVVQRGQAGPDLMRRLAAMLTGFHRKAEVIRQGHDAAMLETEFRDLATVIPFLQGLFGAATGRSLRGSLDQSAVILAGQAERLAWRLDQGFTRDGHGDLHCRNIFLEGEPRLFDCLEFDDRLRQVDLLAELAFLGADLQGFGRPDLWDIFMAAYQSELPLLFTDQDHALLRWYLWYRANVRLKVLSLAQRRKDHPDRMALQSALELYDGFGRLQIRP
jgi:uncharacterized protein